MRALPPLISWPTPLVALALLAALALPAAAAPPAPKGATRPAPKAPPAATRAPVERITGELGRAKVQAVFARGPQPFIASLRVKAAFDGGGRFIGFQLLRILPGSPLEGSERVLPGDIITGVNGQAIERPEEFMSAWDKARGADALEIDLLRGQSALRYRWRLVP